MSMSSSNVTLWSQECHVSSFQNLKILDIYYSGGLQSLGSPSLFAALVQLEELRIRFCQELQEVITEEKEGHGVCEPVIVFPSLKHLAMFTLRNVKRFYGGSSKFEFPVLKSLILASTPRLTNFDGSENLTTLFSDKETAFPCLEELSVQTVSDKVVRLWNWSSSDVPPESKSASIPMNRVPNLQKLTLGKTTGQCQFHLSSLKICLIENKFLFSISSVNRESLWTYSQVPKLENLSIDDSDSLEILFENEDDAATIRLCGQLTRIMLSRIPGLKLIPVHLLKNIRSLSLFDLGWEYVFSADLFIRDREQLQLLETLKISYCKNMEVLIKDELVDGADRVYVFPRLKSLRLHELNIRYFANGEGSALHFPSLERLELAFCYEIRSLCSGSLGDPKLKQVEVCKEMRCFLPENVKDAQELPCLESVIIEKCSKLLSFSSAPLAISKLHDVNLEECPKIKWFFPGDPNHDDVLDLLSLEKVSINYCPRMRSFATSGIKASKLREL